MFSETFGTFGVGFGILLGAFVYYKAIGVLYKFITGKMSQDRAHGSYLFVIGAALYFPYYLGVNFLFWDKASTIFWGCALPGAFAFAFAFIKEANKYEEVIEKKKTVEEASRPFNDDHIRFKKGKDGAVIEREESALSKTPEVLKLLSSSDGDGVLVAFSVTNLKGAEVEKEKEVQSAQTANNEFHKLGWRSSVEDRAIVIGVPGSGKTTYLVSQLIDWMVSGRSFIATDIKPEIWSILKENGIFEKFGYKDYVINPTCEHSHRYNMFAEIENDADLNEVLSVIIAAGAGDAAVFNDNARRLLKAVLLHLGKDASLPAARDFIIDAGSTEDLLNCLIDSEKKSVQRIGREIKATAGNERLLASILTTMNKAFEFLDDENISASIARSDFNMKEVLKKKRVAVFLQFEQKYKNSVATLFGATVAYTLRVLQTNANERTSAVFVALDEIINAAPIPKFSEFLNTIRSSKMPLTMYLQSIEGLNKLYGPGSDALFIGASDLKVVFRVNDNPTAGFVSLQSGETVEHSRSFSTTVDPLPFVLRNGRSDDSCSSSDGYRRTALVDSYDVLSLPPGNAIILYRGAVGQLKMPSYHLDFPMPHRASLDPRPSFYVDEKQPQLSPTLAPAELV